MHLFTRVIAVVMFITSSAALSGEFKLSSKDISHGKFMSKEQEFNGFGCTGRDISPHLAWENLPKGTQSLAITAYDPDAPTGSGWWHWQVVNIPVSVSEVLTGDSGKALINSRQIENDYGVAAFGGACPPKGHGVHRYRFSVHALKVEKLELPKNASGALTGYMINANTIESSTIEALYQRN